MEFHNHQPFYFYLSDDAVESLAFRVALRKVSDSPIATSRVNTCSEVCVPSGNTGAILQTIAWQEKLPEPREAITRLREEYLDEFLDAKGKNIPACTNQVHATCMHWCASHFLFFPMYSSQMKIKDTETNAIIFTYTDQDLSDSIKNTKRSNARWAEYNRNKEDPFQVMKIVVAVDYSCKR